MTLLPYLRHTIKLLDKYHAKYLEQPNGWRRALLFERAIRALEVIVYHMEAE